MVDEKVSTKNLIRVVKSREKNSHAHMGINRTIVVPHVSSMYFSWMHFLSKKECIVTLLYYFCSCGKVLLTETSVKAMREVILSVR